MKKLVWCLFIVIACASGVWAADLYVSPFGSGSTCSATSPCTVAQSMSLVRPGDHIKMQNGTYSGSNAMFSCNGISGTASARIYVEAINEGAVLIDGQQSYVTLRLGSGSPCNYWTFQGINVANSSADIIAVASGSAYNEFKRVVVWDANPGGNYYCISVFSTNGPN